MKWLQADVKGEEPNKDEERLCAFCEQPLEEDEDGAHYVCWAAESAWGEMVSDTREG